MPARRMITIAITSALAMTAFGLVPAGAPAGLKAGPLEYETVTGMVGPGQGTSVGTVCSYPGRVTGGGGAVAVNGTASGEPDTALATTYPVDGGDLGIDADDGFRTAAYNATTESRALSVTAICLADGGSLSYRRNKITINAGVFSQAVACGNQRLLGGGAYVQGPYGVDSALVSTNPFDDDDANALADDGWGYSAVRPVGGLVDAAAHAICLPKGERPIRYRQKTVKAGGAAKVGGAVAGAARVSCPKGTHASGGGVVGEELRIRASVPFDGSDANSAPDDGWRARFYSPGGADSKVTVHVICLR
jgi:hypothetical protein